MSYHLLVKLSRDISQLFDTAAYYDVIIRVGKGADAKEFQAHSLILRARSTYFRGNLRGDSVYDKILIDKSNITPAVFEVILKYIYSGKVDFMNCEGQQTFDLLYAAKELGLFEILESIQDHLIYQQTEWMDANFVTHFRTIFSHDSFKSLQVHYTTKIAQNPLSIFENPKCFNPEILRSLDNSGCIKLNEAMWGFIVNWARSQIPRLGNQVSGWQREDWIEFKEILASCIPWKSVKSLNWNEFNDLLIPCEPFLPQAEFEESLKHHLIKACGSSTAISSPISIQFNGTTLNICHATLLASWIDRRGDNPYRPAEIPYEFKLVVRGRRDGFSPETFHQKCEGIPRTITVFKINNSALCGGYNPLDWKYGHTTSDSFVFYFDHDRADIERLNGFAIQKRQGYGPCFGEELIAFPDGKRAIMMKVDEGLESLQVIDYEVFQIMDKPRRSNFASTAHDKNVNTHKKR
ncbi:5125_t:CDS:2 [Acaulospora morrowiae]|uniref:5125_t:CDS:1 n=1 Tax=Acaulospora morrowiae TaxID=94023 RepID=A0A9N9GX95_9GLOM|nr:5125_t:CDS:2 [Acaulospora morrowiae]